MGVASAALSIRRNCHSYTSRVGKEVYVNCLDQSLAQGETVINGSCYYIIIIIIIHQMLDTVLHSRDIKMNKTGSRHETARLGEELDTEQVMTV